MKSRGTIMVVEFGVSKNSVLIVDNNPEEVDFLSTTLSEEYIVHKQCNTKDALAFIETQKPDVILLDEAFKDILTSLSSSPETEKTPVIILLDIDNIEDEDENFLSGAIDFIQKPLPAVVVKSRVRNYMRIVNQKRILEQLGDIDHLTGMFSQQFLMNRLDQEWLRAVRESTPLSLLVIAIDDLNLYDSPQKEKIIEGVASIIKKNTKRAMDVSARCDDDLIVCLLPNTPAYGAAIVSEMIRKSMENFAILQNPGDITVHMSVNCSLPDMNCESKNFFYRAIEILKGLDIKNSVYTVKPF